MYGSLNIGKVKDDIWLLHVYIYLEVLSSCIQAFRVSLAACVTNFHLEHSFYIDISKNIISYFNTQKMLLNILLPISCKKNETSLIFYTIWKTDRR